MIYNELNNFIKNYIENDITGRAIMLTGTWGSGKSYYVKNTLKNFLEDDNGGKHKCVIVSLYGLSTTSEISKAIYMELRTTKRETKSEAKSTSKIIGKVVGKTILNGLTSKIGFDIGDIKEKDLQKVYESINLNGKLIILEDLERTQIDIIEVLGYVNNLCENDGVKILLVANEDKLITWRNEEIKSKSSFGQVKIENKKIYTEKSLKYIEAKEKTISDTLQFYSDNNSTIDSIISEFKNYHLNEFKQHLNIRNEIFNYREFIVACQKSCDIYRFIEENSIVTDDSFWKCIFISLAYYLQRKLNNPDLKFKEGHIFDSYLSGNSEYPLMKFCFNYYHFQILDKNEIKKTASEYKDYLLYIDTTGYNDKDLKVLYSLFIHSEKELNEIINNIFNRLDDINDISLNHYDRIINNLLVLKYDAGLLNEKIDCIIEKILNNLKGRGEHFTDKKNLFTSTLQINNEDGVKEFNKIKTKVFESLDYTPKQDFTPSVENYTKMIASINIGDIRQNNHNRLVEGLSFLNMKLYIANFSAKTLDILKKVFWSINYNTLNEENLNSIIILKDEINTLLKKEKSEIDCIQKLQLKWIINAIDTKLIESGLQNMNQIS